MNRRKTWVELPELPGRVTVRLKVGFEASVSGRCPPEHENSIREAIVEALKPRRAQLITVAVEEAVKRGVPETEAREAVIRLLAEGWFSSDELTVFQTSEAQAWPVAAHESHLVVGVDPFEAVVVLSEEDCAGMRAFNRAETWGEFRKLAPPTFRAAKEAEWIEARERAVEEGEPVALPPDDASFDPNDFFLAAEGEYPWPAQHMMDHLPLGILLRHGERARTIHSGDYVEIEPSVIDALVHDLELCGYSCRRDDAAIQAATQQ